MKDLKVLLVDDEVEFVSTLAERLKLREIQARTAPDGKTALQMVQEEQPHVVVLDVMMPEMDGIETLKEIKKIAPLVEVILLTGYARLELALKGMELGAFDYLIKSIGIDELLYKLEDAYKKISIQEQKRKHIQEMIKSEK
ncbi:MAG: response regulator [Deltaproteobacteria bacterium]|nr:MAG: response regulator [Deltaproteobacteria bacterium]